MSYRNNVDLTECQICKIKHEDSSLFDVHHITHQNVFKRNNEKVNHNRNNKVSLCPNCHRKVHIGEITVIKWVKSAPDGMLLMIEVNGEIQFK